MCNFASRNAKGYIMNRSSEIIRTSWIGIAANILLAAFKAVDVVPDISVHDEPQLAAQLTDEIKALLPADLGVSIVIDHNYIA